MTRKSRFKSSSRARSRMSSHASSARVHKGQIGSEHKPTALNRTSAEANFVAPDDGGSAKLQHQEEHSSDAIQAQESVLPDDDTLQEIVMAVNLASRDTVGCCYYVAKDEKLYFMEDIEFGNVDVVDSLKLFIVPTVVLISARVDDSVVDCFDPKTQSCDSTEDNDPFRLPYQLDIRPPNEFNYEPAKMKLANLDLSNRDDSKTSFVTSGEHTAGDNIGPKSNSGQYAQLLRLAGWIDMDSRITVGCAGAVISYLQRRRATAYLPGDRSAHLMFRILALEMFSLRDSMFVNADTLHSLQILDNEAHPHSHNRGPTKGNSGAKEGLSVYGLFHHLARTTQGRFLLRQQFVRPSLNLDTIVERLDVLDVLVHPENEPVMQDLVRNLTKISNMRVILINLRKGIGGLSKGGGGFSRNVWRSVIEFAFHALKIRDAVQELQGGENLMIRIKVLETFIGYHLAQVGSKISETVDFDSSIESSRTVVLPNVDEELDQMKRNLDGLESLLNEVAKNLSEAMPADLRSALNVIYFPQIGFLLTMPIDPLTGSAVYDGGQDDHWEKMFSTEQQIYFKNSQMREMDDHFGDIYDLISNREIEIGHELAQYVLEHEELIISCSDICGELDSLLALAQGAKLYNLCRPQMTLENVIHIKGGRHILQELSVSSFVPNDTIIVGGSEKETVSVNTEFVCDGQGDSSAHSPSDTINEQDGPSMLIMTGPNYSGKSVYLKQVALIVYMAHIGCFVAAESASIGLTDKILSRVTTRETVSRMQSAFVTDLQQMSLALSLATSRSLLIIDEFGKGTESNDGMGLACAVMEHLLSLGPKRPKVIGATHFHEIFELGLLQPRSALTFGHMEVSVEPDASRIDDQITYLYNFRCGRSTSSFGTCCAALNGIPPEIVKRAEDLVVLSMRGEDLAASHLQMPRDEIAELEEAEHVARKFLMVQDFDDAETILADTLTGSAIADSCS